MVRERGGALVLGMATYTLVDLLYCVPCVRGAGGVLAEEHCFRYAVDESDGVVFPVADVVSESDVEHFVAEIEAVKVEVERVEYAVAFVDCDHDDWCAAASTLTTGLQGFLRVGLGRLVGV